MLEVDESEEKLKATGLWDSLRHEMAFRLEALAIGLDLEALSSSCLALLFPTWLACCGDAQDVRARWPTGVSRLHMCFWVARAVWGHLDPRPNSVRRPEVGGDGCSLGRWEVEDVPLDDDEGSPPRRPPPPPADGAPERVWASKGITGLLETVGAEGSRPLEAC